MKRWVLLSFLFTFSCYKVPDYLLQEIPTQLALSDSIQTALQSPGFQVGPWPDANWWEWFEDPQLSRLIEIGLENSPDLKKAEARLAASLTIATQVRSKLFPHLNFFFQENYQHLSKHGFEREFAFHAPSPVPPIFSGVDFASLATPVPAVLNVLDLGFRMDWDLDLFGKRRYQWTSAIDQARALEAQAQQVRLVLSSQIAQAYFSYQTHLAVLDNYKEITASRTSLQKLVQRRAQIGLDTQFETIAANIDLSELEKVVYDLEASVALDKHRLLVLMGKSPDTDEEITPRFVPLASRLTLPETISSNLLARRPDLMAEIWQVESAGADIGAAKAQFYPEINLQGLMSLRSVFPEDLFSLSSAALSLLPSFSVPVFRGGELKANLQEKYSRYEEMVQSYHQTFLNALQQIADLLAQAESTRKQLSTQNTILDSTLTRKDLKQKLYRTGIANHLSVIEFELLNLTEKTKWINLQSDQILLAVKIMQALGGGYLSSIEVPEKFIGPCNDE